MKSLIPKSWNRGDSPSRRFGASIFDDPFFSADLTRAHGSLMQWPSIDVDEDEKQVTVRAEIPGMTEKDIDLSYQDGVLTIKGEKRDQREEKKKNSYYRESWAGSFCRSIPLGSSLDWQHVAAHYKNGVLDISIPKVEGRKNTINVTVE